VKVVQRLPVRIEVLDYDREKAPLFIGLSVTPYVRINEKPEGPNAGKLLQPYATAVAREASAIATPAAASGAASPKAGTSP
jgi:membrane fusion protein (multidrug efflux system)